MFAAGQGLRSERWLRAEHHRLDGGRTVPVETTAGVASKLTPDRELQKDLMQEMLLHLLRIQNAKPGKTEGWYIRAVSFTRGTI